MNAVKPTLIVLILVAAIVAIGKIFWEQELKYTKPTPVPEGYRSVPIKTVVDLGFAAFRDSQKPKHLHFYNPDCPCSKFNLSHYSSLVQKYQGSIDFYVVIPSKDQLAGAKEEFGANVSVIADTDKHIARECGVYSTPQAVLIDKDGKLYYRGNYNKTRYCTNRSSNYAELAIESLLANKEVPEFGALATTAYGCELDTKSWFYALTY